MLQERYLYFPFLFPPSVLQSFFSFSASSLFGTQQQFTHPSVKSSTLPLKKMPVFQGTAPWHKVFTSFCVILLWESARARSCSGQELISSSLVELYFSGPIVTKQYYDLPQKVPDYVSAPVKINELPGTAVLNIVIFKTFCHVRCANELSNFVFYTSVSEKLRVTFRC